MALDVSLRLLPADLKPGAQDNCKEKSEGCVAKPSPRAEIAHFIAKMDSDDANRSHVGQNQSICQRLIPAHDIVRRSCRVPDALVCGLRQRTRTPTEPRVAARGSPRILEDTLDAVFHRSVSEKPEPAGAMPAICWQRRKLPHVMPG